MQTKRYYRRNGLHVDDVELGSVIQDLHNNIGVVEEFDWLPPSQCPVYANYSTVPVGIVVRWIKDFIYEDGSRDPKEDCNNYVFLKDPSKKTDQPWANGEWLITGLKVIEGGKNK